MLIGSITFASGAGAFFIGGSNFDVNDGNFTITQSASNAQSIANDILHSGGNNTVRTLTLAGTGAGVATLSGVISDSNGNRRITLTKSGSSTFVLSGANTYDNGTTIGGGVLRITNASALGGGSVTVNTGTLEIANLSLTANTLALNNGATLLGTGSGASYSNSGNPVIGSGASVTLATSASGDVLSISSGYTNAISSTATPTVNISNPGGGRVTLGSGNSTFRGNWNIQSGTLQSAATNNTFGIGNTSGSLTGSTITLAGGNLEVRGAGGNLVYNAGTAGAEVAMKFNNDGTVAAGRAAAGAGVTHTFGALTLGNSSDINAAFTYTASVTSGTSAFTFGALTLSGNPTVTVNQPSTPVSQVTFGAVGQTGGTRSITKAGPGTLIFSAANTYSGSTTVSGGNLIVNSASNISTSDVTINGGSLVLNNTSQSIANLSGTGGTLNLTPTALTHTGTASASFAGAIIGTGSITKNGSGTLVLTGTSNTYSGVTNIRAGELKIDGSLGTGGTVTVGNNSPNTGAIAGNGTIGRAVSVIDGGSVAPGDFQTAPYANNTIGKLTSTASFTLTTGAKLQLELAGNAGTVGIAGTNFDQLAVTGAAFTPGGATLVVIPLNGAVVGQPYRIVTGASSITGIFANLAENVTYNQGQGVIYKLNYNSGGTGEIDLTFSAVPEPGSVGLVATLGAMLLGRRRRRASRNGKGRNMAGKQARNLVVKIATVCGAVAMVLSIVAISVISAASSSTRPGA